jgi:hypothetical protein
MPSSTRVKKKECLEQEALCIEEDSHDYIFDEIFRRGRYWNTKPELKRRRRKKRRCMSLEKNKTLLN